MNYEAFFAGNSKAFIAKDAIAYSPISSARRALFPAQASPSR